MDHTEFIRLCGYSKAKRNRFRPSRNVTSRRNAKHPSVGQVLKSTRVVAGVALETIFNHPSWK